VESAHATAVTSYTFTMQAAVVVPAGSQVVIAFPSDYTGITQGAGTCDFESVTISCGFAGNNLSFALTANMSNTYLYTFNVSGLTNPGSARTTAAFLIYYYSSSGALIGSCASGNNVVIVPILLPYASISPASTSVATNCTWTVSFVTSQVISSNAYIELTSPVWNSGLGAPFSRYYCSSSVSLTCSGILSNF
jgi:hypothetical protein